MGLRDRIWCLGRFIIVYTGVEIESLTSSAAVFFQPVFYPGFNMQASSGQ